VAVGIPAHCARTLPSTLGNSSSGMPPAALLVVQHVELDIFVLFIHWDTCSCVKPCFINFVTTGAGVWEGNKTGIRGRGNGGNGT
jgi:hypothetical protein